MLLTWTTQLADDAATARIGGLLFDAMAAEQTHIAQQGLTLALQGPLGAGKTTLVRALLRAAGITGPIKSPTFAVLEPYKLSHPKVSNLDFHHFDFYRFSEAAEFSDIGFRELFGPGKICVMEWPERVADRLPAPDLRLVLDIPTEGATEGRTLHVEATTELGASCLNLIRNAF